MTRHFITIDALDDADLRSICHLATAPIDDEALRGQGVALVFERPSLRTRASSSAAVHELGGFTTFFSDEEIGLDSRESAEDIARTISEMYSVAALRVRNHGVFARMARATDGRLALINLLSDAAHPTQAVADASTLADQFVDGDVTGLGGYASPTSATRRMSRGPSRPSSCASGWTWWSGRPGDYQLARGGPEDAFVLAGPGRCAWSGRGRGGRRSRRRLHRRVGLDGHGGRDRGAPTGPRGVPRRCRAAVARQARRRRAALPAGASRRRDHRRST